MRLKFNKTQKAWSFYDWANSVYSLVIGTVIFPIYYESITEAAGKETLIFLGFSFHNTELYSYTISLSFLIIALISPYLAALADSSGRKKDFMRIFVYIGSLACISLLLFTEDRIWIGLLGALFASLGFTGSLVFYNAFLPEIAEPSQQDRLSARGFALGYLGSSLLLIFNLLMIEKPEWFGISDAGTGSRISFFIVGLWWLGFSYYVFKHLPNGTKKETNGENNFLSKGYKNLRIVWDEFKGIPRLRRFLYAFFWYSTGVQTVVLLAALFGSKVLNLKSDQLIISILIIQFVAIAGALLFSRLSEKIGNIKALGIAVFIWIGVCIAAFLIDSANQFYMVGALVGLVLGGIQSLSRSTFSKMLPETKDHATYFSFFDVTEKVATMAGMLGMGLIESITGDLRNAALVLMTFFILGFIQLLRVPKSKHVY